MARKKVKPMTVAEQVKSAVEAMDGLRWDTDYEYHNDCSECNPNDYHRNCVITDFRIKSVNVKSCVDSVIKDIKDPILRYCIERILIIGKIYDPECWDWKVSRGYYGEEIDDIYWNGKYTARTVMESLINLSDRDRIFAILEYEYNIILPKFKTIKTFSIETVPVSDIVFGSMRHAASLTGGVDYSDWPVPIGVCMFNKGKFHIIDGYHRLTDAVKNKVKEVSVVVGR